MKKVIISAGILGSIFSATKVQAQQGIGTITPDKSSILHLQSEKRGLLIPNVSIPDLNQPAPVNAPAKSLLVYNTNTTSGEGFYYWDGAKWVRFTSSVNQPTVTLANGENTTVASTQSGNNTVWKVNVAAANGTTLGLVKEAAANAEVAIDSNGVLSINEGNISLEGDVTGPLNATKVTKIQGTEVTPLNTADLPGENGKVLTYNDTTGKWEPTTPSIAAGDVSGAGNLTAENTTIVVTDGNGATLKNAKVKVNTGGITANELANNAVTTDKINDGAVTTGKINDGAVTTGKLGADAVTNEKLADNAVQTENIKNEAVTPVKLQSGGNDKVMVTDATGNVEWIDKSTLVTANQKTTKVTATGPLAVTETNPSTNVTSYDVKVTPGTAGQVLVTNAAGTGVEWQTAATTVTANNGLTKTADDKIQLGGSLVKPTTITTDNTNTLAVGGLETPTAGNTMVVEQNGVLRKLAQSIKGHINGVTTTTFSVGTDLTGYNKYVPQVFITATIGTTTDINLNLPAAADAEGQIINIKLLNTTDTGHYLNINDNGGTPLTYGGVPYQGWILKSDGTSWRIVGSN